MENASKALIMAGSVLLAMIVISLLVIFFGNLRGLKQTELTAEQIEQMQNINQEYEIYKKDIYGSEVLSLTNKISDYKKRKVEIEGYPDIELYVTISQDIDSEYFKAKKDPYTAKELKAEIEKLEKKAKNETKYKSIITEVKSRIFKLKKFEYDNNTGNIKELHYELFVYKY